MLLLIGLCLQIPGIILLYFAAIQMSWSIQTWNGESKKEKEFRRKQLILGKTGLILVLIGYIFILIPYLREIF